MAANGDRAALGGPRLPLGAQLGPLCFLGRFLPCPWALLGRDGASIVVAELLVFRGVPCILTRAGACRIKLWFSVITFLFRVRGSCVLHGYPMFLSDFGGCRWGPSLVSGGPLVVLGVPSGPPGDPAGSIGRVMALPFLESALGPYSS